MFVMGNYIIARDSPKSSLVPQHTDGSKLDLRPARQRSGQLVRTTSHESNG
jgi:hypothetical protein